MNFMYYNILIVYYAILIHVYYTGSVLVVALSDRIFWATNALLALLSFMFVWIFIFGKNIRNSI